MKKWRIEDSEELYNIKGWGVNFFGINEKGHVYVEPKKNGTRIDLKEVVDRLATRHVAAFFILYWAARLFKFQDLFLGRIKRTVRICCAFCILQMWIFYF